MTSRKRQSRKFTPIARYISTAFERRVQAELDRALLTPSQVILLGLPREGKTWALDDWMTRHPVTRSSGVTRTDVLTADVSPNGRYPGLMYSLGARISRAMPLKATPYELGLIRWTINAGVALIVLDEAQRMPREMRTWMWGFIDKLRHPADSDLEGIQVGLVYMGAGLPRGVPETALFGHRRTKVDGTGVDLDWIQFEGRLDGAAPLVWLHGLDLAETGEVLAGYEQLYRSQFPDLELQTLAPDLFDELLDETIDYARVNRARMDSITKVVLNGLQKEADAGGRGETIADHLADAVATLQTRPADLEDFDLVEAYRPVIRENPDGDVPEPSEAA